jgi:hypothetical protein
VITFEPEVIRGRVQSHSCGALAGA